MIDNKLFLSLPECELLALLIYGEARGEIYNGKLAVAHVIQNRANLFSWFGKNIKDVCLKKWQFSCFNPGEPSRKMLLDLAQSEQKPNTYYECLKAAKAVLSGNCTDITNGSTHYYAPKAMIPKDRKPDWANSMQEQCKIGNHIFYK